MLNKVRRPARIHREAKLLLDSMKYKRISQYEWDAGAVRGLADDLIQSMDRPEVSYGLDELYVVARFLHDAKFDFDDVIGIEESKEGGVVTYIESDEDDTACQIVLMAICMMMRQRIEDGVMKVLGGLLDESTE